METLPSSLNTKTEKLLKQAILRNISSIANLIPTESRKRIVECEVDLNNAKQNIKYLENQITVEFQNLHRI